MPPLPELRLATLAELERQLRYAPRSRLLDNVARIEALAGDVDSETNYPEEWIEFRVTGLRRDLPEAITVTGAALRSDLSSLAERLSERAHLSEAELVQSETEAGQPPPVRADALAERWNVSRKTVDRYRKRGLIGRRVRAANSKPVIVFTASAIECFERTERDRLDRAAQFDRIDPATELKLLRRASRYHELFGCTLNQAAARLARRFDRSHEGVRQLLRKHDASAPTPIFTDERTLSAVQRRALSRAERRGLEPIDLARRLGRPRATIVRLIHLERARLLGDLALEPVGPAPEPPEIAPPPAAPAPRTIGGLLTLMRTRTEASPELERAWLGAMSGWRALAADRVRTLDRAQPEATLLDEAETYLRRAACAHAALTRSTFALLMGTIERRLGKEPERLPTDDAAELLRRTIVAAAEAVAKFDPKRGGRLAAPVGLVADRVAGAWMAERTTPPDQPEGADGPGRAGPTLRVDAPADDWRVAAGPWQSVLATDPRLLARPETDDPADTGRPPWWAELSAEHRETLACRFGQPGGAAPSWAMTLDELAEHLGTGRAQAPGRVRAAVRAALAASRSA
ncbi:MAG: hypothetical protein AAF138_06895 [Planctomycetota bacterium]